MTITLEVLDWRWFPRECCGVTYANARRFMDHVLPAHEVARDSAG